jgi:DNA-binding response OmpR family regulator
MNQGDNRMNSQPVLVVDDERNIRMTISMSLESMGLEIDEAVNGEDALQKIDRKQYRLVLLDLKLPGMDGMEVLRRVRNIRPDIRTIIITAHGTIENAVEAMKLGAVDYIQKPFSPNEIRELVKRVIDRDAIEEQKAADYAAHFELAKRRIAEQQFDAAAEHAGKAIAFDNSRPEAFNLLGAIKEIQKDIPDAQKYYRAALALDPSYEPARKNIERTARWTKDGAIVIGDIPPGKGK